ncbi:MAG TPA: asparagine synthase (glutamine-hydrolyzing) [Azospirillaceae bacterium]|nr:asparagine synthase (glutamine-hydrolyzing) [Azospirillaceae bacterium]
MCGIVGIFHLTREAPPVRPALEAMAEALVHRGPDDDGFHEAPGIGFGFRRLAIVDLVSGNQPMFAADGAVAMVCNGEIYNHTALRAELAAKGHVFRTRSDVEVIPALYLEHGPGFPTRLNGQFAAAIYDGRRHRLVLARDHVGIAPLFWAEITTEAGPALVFASEIKALLRHPAVPRQVDLTGVDQILTFPGPVSPRTVFTGIHSLPPGHVLVSEADRIAGVAAYWDLDYPTLNDPRPARPPEEHLDALDAALRQAVRYRLQADVPVACYLSGGLDSSLIAALAHDLTPSEIRHSFSITFDDAAIDERHWQRLMAGRLGTLHHETEVGPVAICDRLKDIVIHAETPLRESYNVCSLILSDMVHSQGMKAVLAGEGADELFGGYVGYRLDRRRAVAADPFDLEAQLEAQMREQIWGDAGFFYEKNYHAFAETKAALYSDAVLADFADIDCLAHPVIDRARVAGRDPLHQRSYIDFKVRMADHLLADHGDRVAFASSVEARYPFLDIGVIDVVRDIPPALMLEGGEEKHLLKRLARRYLPAEITGRQKFSFVAPGSPDLLRQSLPWVEDLLSYERVKRQGYFNPDTVEHLKSAWRKPGFRLNQTFEDDLLMVVLTFGILLDAFQLPDFA